MPGHGRQDVQVVLNWRMRQPSLLSVSSRARREDGVVALETFFSILLIFVMTVLFWGVAAMLHNQAVLNGATQLAAQESLIVYDRLTFRKDTDANQDAAEAEARATAVDVYYESTRGMLNERFVGGSFTESRELAANALTWQITCGRDWGSSLSNGNCGQGDDGRVEQVTANATAPAGLWLVDWLNDASPSRADATLSARGAAYAAGPCARTAAEAGASC